jgi:hypothetical protein
VVSGRLTRGDGGFAEGLVPFAILPPVRVLRSLIVAAVLALGVATPAAAQTTTTSTTMPPVRSIPVTPAPNATTTTTARAATTTTTTTTAAVSGSGTGTGTGSEDDPLADTGLAADKLVPLAFLLIALGAVLDAGARRYRRTAYSYF